MKSILCVAGSLREGSFNRQLAQAAGAYLESMPAGGGASETSEAKAHFELLDFSDVPLFNQDIEHASADGSAPDAVARVRQQVKEADGVWFFTPEYNHSIPGVLKNLVDWLSRPISETEPQVLAGKPVAISGITPGISGTLMAQDQLVVVLSFLNADIMNAPRLTIPGAMSQVHDGKLELDASRKYLEREADAFLEFIESRAR